jgi:hypothetical protein
MKPREEGPSLIDCAAPQADVAGLVARATQAHQVLMQGDIAQYRASMPLADDFTLMAPFGGPPTRDGRYTDEAWAAIGRFFRAGRDSTFELVRAYRSSELVCLVAIERSHVEVGGLPGRTGRCASRWCSARTASAGCSCIDTRTRWSARSA